MAKWSQFHNWVFVVALLHFGNNHGFIIKTIVGGTTTNSFFARLLQGKLHCIRELFTLEKIIGVKPLLRNLLLQMDKCVKDNKKLAFVGISFTINCEGCVWRSETEISCHWPYTWGYWQMFWPFVKEVKILKNYILVNLMRAFMVS